MVRRETQLSLKTLNPKFVSFALLRIAQHDSFAESIVRGCLRGVEFVGLLDGRCRTCLD